jgi:dihydrofolate synthase/folylpolyglutamate synthase
MFLSDLKHSDTTLLHKLRILYSLNRGAKLNLGFRPQYLRLLEKLGNPHLQCPPTIHVAGTNGKGSTIAFLRAILEADGKSVHTYTSPHLIEFNERIVLASQKITDQALEALIDEILSLIDDEPLSFFEITTAIAFAAFARNPADYLLLETGLGGRLDCTNVIEKPLATIITPIGLDHQEFLGETVTEIATEKAGIMKYETPCIIAPQNHKNVQNTLKLNAKKIKAPLFIHGSEWRTETNYDANHDTFRVTFKNISYQLKSPTLCGFHQIQNASTAIAAHHIIAPQNTVSKQIIQTGLQSARWPARMQNITAHVHLPEDWECYLDGGHNNDAAQIIVNQIKIWGKTNPKPTHLIIGMMNHKNPQGFIKILTPCAATIHRATIPGETTTGQPWQDIIQSLTSGRQPPSRILICGSLYLAGHVLQSLNLQA